MPFHRSSRALPLAGADDVDRLDILEELDRERLAFAEPGLLAFRAKFANVSLRLRVNLRDVTAFRLSGYATRLVEESELHAFVAVAFASSNLQDQARTRLDYGDRYGG